jgi:putative glutamine amidotransferase
MTTPMIGLSTYRAPGNMTIYDGELAVLPSQYVEAVTQSGGLAVLLPPQLVTAEQATAIIGRLDGLVVTGGADINPQRYGQELGTHTQASEDLRDSFEDALLRAALHLRMPILGICRGAQMLNVHLGGTLHQHLPDVLGHHRYQAGDGLFHPEVMNVEEGTLLQSVLGGDATVTGRVYHHQGIDDLAPSLRVSARGFDGVIQAIEVVDYAFGLALQWHPEESLDDLRVFEALVQAASHAPRRH